MRRASRLLALTAVLAAGCVYSGAAPTVAPPTVRAGVPSTATDDALPSEPRAARPGDVATKDTTPPARASRGDTSRVVKDSVSASDVTREAARMFGAETPPPVTDTIAAPGAPVWDIDVRSYETRARVEEYVRIFSGRAKGIFAVALQRQTRYGPMIRERLRRIGLPEDMIYLALVESWFNPHAYSRAAAVGMWQFMAGTGRGMGLRVDWWMDERRDPVRSTEAAARLLLAHARAVRIALPGRRRVQWRLGTRVTRARAARGCAGRRRGRGPLLRARRAELPASRRRGTTCPRSSRRHWWVENRRATASAWSRCCRLPTTRCARRAARRWPRSPTPLACRRTACRSSIRTCSGA